MPEEEERRSCSIFLRGKRKVEETRGLEENGIERDTVAPRMIVRRESR